jgi:putative copper export protein
LFNTLNESFISHHAILLNASSISGITFIYWAALFVHLFCSVAWLGGILFLTGVARPIFEYDPEGSYEISQRLKIRFLGFSWMLAWSTFVSGIIVLLWSTKFVFFDFATTWRALAHVKFLLFIVLFFVTLGLRSSYRDLTAARASTEEGEDLTPRQVLLWRVRMFEQIEVWLAIFLLAIVSIMQVY